MFFNFPLMATETVSSNRLMYCGFGNETRMALSGDTSVGAAECRRDKEKEKKSVTGGEGRRK
jgi:hypothetical protein